MSPGGMLWFQSESNLQYTNSAGFVIAVYSEYLLKSDGTVSCPGGTVSSRELLNFARSQVDYILGSNPNKISYMIGYGTNYPTRVHHRAASIPSIKTNPTPVDCKAGFDLYFHVNTPNPNVLEGAVVGGPDENDSFTESRENFNQCEPSTVVNAPLVGLLAAVA